MTEPTITSPKCNSGIKLTKFLAVPLIPMGFISASPHMTGASRITCGTISEGAGREKSALAGRR